MIFHVLVLADVGEINVGHAQLFALVYIWRAAQGMDEGREHFRAQRAEEFAVAAVAADLPRLVVVAQIDGIPGFALEIQLPAVQDRAHVIERRAVVAPLSQFRTVVQAVVVLKSEHHVQLFAVRVGIAQGIGGRSAGFPHGQQVVLAEHALAHFLQIAVRGLGVQVLGAGDVIEFAGSDGPVVKAFLADHADHVHAKAVDALVAPPGHHIEDGVPDLGIGPVEVRLLLGEEVQVILVAGGVILPGGSGEAAAPVVGRAAVDAVAPDVIIAVGIVLALGAFHKPAVLVGSVIHHEVHDQFHAARVRFTEQTVEILHRAEFLHDGAVVGDIVPVVMVGRSEERADPDHVDA